MPFPLRSGILRRRTRRGHLLDSDIAPLHGSAFAFERQVPLPPEAVLTAADGAEAVEVFRRYGGRIRLVVLDMTMPVMGGEETIVHLRAIDPGIPVLVMSGYGEVEATRRFDGTPADGFLQKPFAAPQLAAAVRAMVTAHTGPSG